MKKRSNLKYYEAVGRRKSAVARVRLYILGKKKEVTIAGIKMKTGEIYINQEPIDQYFPQEAEKIRYQEPLVSTATLGWFAVSILVKGGGRTGQLDAIVHGIARALELTDKNFRPLLKKQGLLTRDARVKESRKVGTGGKARRQKQSPKR